jgi:glycyl-tRNA synthetase
MKLEDMETIVSLCKNRGFIYPGSEIYGGLANSWDYGPLGVELKNNVKKAWNKKFIQERNDSVGLDSAIIMNPKTWEATGHVTTFNDPLIDCKSCKTRHRADKLIENWGAEHDQDICADGMSMKS